MHYYSRYHHNNDLALSDIHVTLIHRDNSNGELALTPGSAGAKQCRLLIAFNPPNKEGAAQKLA